MHLQSSIVNPIQGFPPAQRHGSSWLWPRHRCHVLAVRITDSDWTCWSAPTAPKVQGDGYALSAFVSIQLDVVGQETTYAACAKENSDRHWIVSTYVDGVQEAAHWNPWRTHRVAPASKLSWFWCEQECRILDQSISLRTLLIYYKLIFWICMSFCSTTARAMVTNAIEQHWEVLRLCLNNTEEREGFGRTTTMISIQEEGWHLGLYSPALRVATPCGAWFYRGTDPWYMVSPKDKEKKKTGGEIKQDVASSYAVWATLQQHHPSVYTWE